MMLYRHSMMLYSALQIHHDALQRSTNPLQTTYEALRRIKHQSTLLYNALQRSITGTTTPYTNQLNSKQYAVYNSQQSTIRLRNDSKHQVVVANTITSRNLLGIFREPSGKLLGISRNSSMDPLKAI